MSRQRIVDVLNGWIFSFFIFFWVGLLGLSIFYLKRENHLICVADIIPLAMLLFMIGVFSILDKFKKKGDVVKSRNIPNLRVVK